MTELARIGSFGRGTGWRPQAATRAGAPGRRVALRQESGMVTAETAVVLPALVGVAVALAWLLAVGALQATVSQAAREGARAAARGESAAAVQAAVRHLAPGAAVTIQRSGDRVAVTAAVQPRPSGRLLRPLARQVRATAVSWWEGW